MLMFLDMLVCPPAGVNEASVRGGTCESGGVCGSGGV